MNEIEKICKSLQPIIGDRAKVLWYTYLTQDERRRRELEKLIQILEAKYLQKNLGRDKVQLIPPAEADAKGEYHLGTIVYNEKELYPLKLRPEDIIKQVGIFSITGEGKTNISLLMALQLLKNKVPFLVIDWKRSWRNLLSLPKEEYPDVDNIKVFTIGRKVSPFYWNPFRPPPGVHYKTWLYVVTEVLEKSHLGGPGVANIFLRIYDYIYRKMGNNENDSKRYPDFFDGLRVVDNMKLIGRELLWKQSASRILKTLTYGPHNHCFNSKYPIKLEELLEKPVILELDQELPKSLRVFLSEIILRWIHMYRLSQGESSSLRHVLFLEEIHNLFPKTKIERDGFNSLENVYREIRGFGQGLVSITQHPSVLPIYVLGNCHTQIMLGLQHEDDIRASTKSLFLEKGQEVFLDLLRVGEGIVKIKGRVNPCLVKFPLVPIKIGSITDDFIKKKYGGYSAYSKSVKPANGRFEVIPHADNKIPKKAETVLIDVNKYPGSGIVERYNRMNMSMRVGDNENVL